MHRAGRVAQVAAARDAFVLAALVSAGPSAPARFVPIATEVIPLGVGSAIPTRDRHLSATALRREGRLLLFDCGEGTQRQLLEAGLLRGRLAAICITHFHGDHLYGLPGLLTTLALQERTEPLTLVGPEGLRRILTSLPGLARDWLPYPVRYVEIAEGTEHQTVFEDRVWTIEARPLDHRVTCFGYRVSERARPGRIDAEAARAAGITRGPDFEALKRGETVTLPDGRRVAPDGLVGPERPGVVVAYCLDTRPCEGGRLLASGADLVIHEATFADAHADRADGVGHSTAREAAAVARDAGARRLLLTHFSARYRSPDDLVAEAREIFPATDAAEELVPIRLEPPA